MRVSFVLEVRETSDGKELVVFSQTDRSRKISIFANMLVTQSVKRQTEELTSMYRKEPKTSTSIFTTKIKTFVLMQKQNQKESASDESIKNLPN